MPGGVLHEHYAGSVAADDVTSVAKHQGENGTGEHEDDEGDIGSISDGAVGPDVDILAERDLVNVR